MSKNWLYRFGKLIAIDIYTTSAGLFIWSGVSRLSAKKRAEKHAKSGSFATGVPTIENIAEVVSSAGELSATDHEKSKDIRTYKKKPIESKGNNYAEIAAGQAEAQLGAAV